MNRDTSIPSGSIFLIFLETQNALRGHLPCRLDRRLSTYTAPCSQPSHSPAPLSLGWSARYGTRSNNMHGLSSMDTKTNCHIFWELLTVLESVGPIDCLTKSSVDIPDIPLSTISLSLLDIQRASWFYILGYIKFDLIQRISMVPFLWEISRAVCRAVAGSFYVLGFLSRRNP